MGGTRPEEGGRIISWQKLQRLRSSKYTLWDHSFELAHKHLEADKPMRATVQVGKKSHKLKILSEDHEIYEFPGGYAQRFDGIAPGGGERPADVQKIFTDNKRTVGLRMEEQEARVMLNRGLSDQRQLMAGHKFTLEKHKEDGDGEYVILSVQHNGSEGSFRGGEGQDGSPSYQNSFTALASAIPFRPPLVTPRPKIAGPQTAVVVGPSGEEIFTDKYGRVKVQFHWDRDGQNDANSSCWCRVSTLGAGTGYGFLLTPRIGWEVIVAFLEGDPDQPIITGCVYNPLNMPFDQLPEKKSVWGLRSRSTLGGSADNFNELRFEDKKGSEQVYLRAEKDLDVYVKNDSRTTIGQDQHEHVKRDRKEQIDRDLLAKVKRNRKTEVGGNDHLKVGGNEVINVGGNLHEQVGNFAQKAGQNHAVEAGMEIHLKAGMKIVIEAGVDLTLKGPGGFVNIGPAGVAIQGTMVLINSGGAAGAGSGASPESPEAPDPPSDADTDKGYTSSGTAS
jgi:type VI secretion system secreted protein VgrG